MQILKVKKSLYPMICCLSDPLKLVLPNIDAGIQVYLKEDNWSLIHKHKNVVSSNELI